MKQAISIVLAFAIVFTVLYTIPSNKEFDIKYVARCFATIATKKVPTLTGGYSFTEFDEAGSASLYLLSYPLRFVFYLISQTVWLFSMLFGVSDPYRTVGFGGGIYQ